MRVPLYAMEPRNVPLLQRTPCVFLLRNFYAVLASAYFEAAYRGRLVEPDPEKFLTGVRHGVMHLITYFNSWIELAEHLPSVTYFSYEALKSNTREELEKLVRVLNLPVRSDLLDQTVQAGGFENMKKLAASEAYQGTVLSPTDPGDPRSAKVRSGKASSYRDVFSKAQLEFVAEMIDRFFIGRDDSRFTSCIQLDGGSAKEGHVLPNQPGER